MSTIDWSVLSGPRVSRRTLMALAAATGATGYARQLALAGAAPVAPGATGREGAAQEGTPGGTLRLGFGISQIPTLDPAQVNLGIIAGELVANIFSSLVQFDTELGLVPDLAESWTVSEDGLDYSFTLRDGLSFHNGDALTSADILYTYERTTNPDFASPHANKLALISAIEAPDDRTVTITLSSPFAPFLAVACSRGPGRALTPVSPRAVEEMGDEQFGRTPVGAGPFAIVAESADLNSGFTLNAFDGWWGGRPFLDAIEVTLITEPSVMVSALEAGDVDMLDIVPAVGVAQLRDHPDISLVEAPGTNWIGLAMNFERPPWDNHDARMAIARALNREDLVERGLFGLADVGVGPIAPAFAWAYGAPDPTASPQSFDIDAARQLAEAAGIVGAQPTVMITVDDPRPAEVIRTQLADIGVELQLDSLQQAAWNERWTVGDFDWIINGSVVDADPDDGCWNFFHTDGPWNTYRYTNPQVDELLLETRTTAEQTARGELFQEIQSILEEDVAYAFLYHTFDITGFSNAVQGYLPIPEMRYLETVWLQQ